MRSSNREFDGFEDARDGRALLRQGELGAALIRVAELAAAMDRAGELDSEHEHQPLAHATSGDHA